MSETTDTVAELRALVAELAARIQTLEEQSLQRHPEVIKAYLGEVRG